MKKGDEYKEQKENILKKVIGMMGVKKQVYDEKIERLE